MKNIRIFYLKNFHFLVVKCLVYLNRRVFIMQSFSRFFFVLFLTHHQGPVVQSVVSLTSSLRVITLTVLAISIYNIQIFLAEKNVSSFCTAKATHIFSAKNFSIFVYHLM